MAASGRKNVHGKAGVRFKAGYTSSKNKAMLRSVVTDLILNGSVKVTSGVKQELVTLAARLVGYAKKNTLASRRLAARYVRNVTDENGVSALKKLFDEIGPKFAARNGGYTRVLKLGARKGDNAEVVLVSWVD